MLQILLVINYPLVNKLLKEKAEIYNSLLYVYMILNLLTEDLPPNPS